MFAFWHGCIGGGFVILSLSTAFLSPDPTAGGPHQSTARRGNVANTDNFIESKPKAEVSLNQPPRCPKCRSTDTSSAAKRPTANSYWRCLKCGDVWNPALLSEPKRWWQR